MDKLQLSERDICTKFITPAIQQAGWEQHQFREEVNLTEGRVMVRGKLAARIRNPDAKGGPKRADYVLYACPNLPIAIVEAKQARFSVGHGMQQALAYAEMLDAPFAISSNGDGFLLHDRTGLTQPVERELSLNSFPSLNELWPIYQQWKDLAEPERTGEGLSSSPEYCQSSLRIRKMRHYFRNSGLVGLGWLLANAAWAVSSISDGDLVVTLKDGKPCFSYPMDEKTRKEPYYFGMLTVSWSNREASLPPSDIWELQSASDDYPPASPQTCMVYGVVKPGTRQKAPAATLRHDVPYRAHLTVFAGHGERKYLAYYCLHREAGGEISLLKAAYNGASNRYECNRD